ncbi:MAG: DUF1203 domain-containing protein [Rhodobacterales bacterium]|nr:DUF1203 domain-containing protein [Rhodobacterales bacterium]MDX5501223.1 DUF1203 domain-containing protein [Rhodobacterales bacterium]
MAYRIRGLDPAPFRKYFGLSDAALAAEGVVRYRVDAQPGFPDRVTMQDLAPGDTALLLNYEHLPIASPYRSRHAIFVQEGAQTPYEAIDTVPEVMRSRIVALRGFDSRGFILDADLAEGDGIDPLIRRLFDNPDIAFVHAHYARRGCYAGLIERA